MSRPLASGSLSQQLLSFAGEDTSTFEDIKVAGAAPAQMAVCTTKAAWDEVIRKTPSCKGWKCAFKFLDPDPLHWAIVSKTHHDALKTCLAPATDATKAAIRTSGRYQEILIPTRGDIRYEADLKSLGWSVNGSVISLKPDIDLTINVDGEQTVLGTSLRFKGLTKCEVGLQPKVDVNIALKAVNGHVQPDIRAAHFDMGTVKVCLPSILRNLNDKVVVDPLTTDLKGAISEGVNLVINDIINKSLNAKVDSNNLDERLTQPLAAMQNGIRLDRGKSDGVWLVPNFSRLTLSPFTSTTLGDKTVFQITAAAVAQPVVTFGKQPSPVDASTIPVVLDSTLSGSNFYLAPEGVLPLASVQMAVQSSVNRFFDKSLPGKQHPSLDIDLYESGNKIAIGLSAVRPGHPNTRPIYLLLQPHFNPALQRIDFASVQIDSKNKAAAVIRLPWAAGSKFAKFLGDDLKLPLGQSLSAIVSQVVDFKTEQNYGTFSGHLSSLRLNRLWVDKDNLHLSLIGQGTSSFMGAVPAISAPVPALPPVVPAPPAASSAPQRPAQLSGSLQNSLNQSHR